MGIRTKLRDERGISAVVVAIGMVAVFSGAVLSVDAGTLFTARRGMVTATDTAALTGARAAIGVTTTGPCPGAVQTAVTNRLLEQQPDATLVDCTLNPAPTANGKAGYLTVDARRAVPLKFGAVLGLGAQSAFSSTSVAYGYPTGAAGLRPIGICIENGHIQEWLTLKQILSDVDPGNDAVAQAAYNALKGTQPPSVDPNPHPNYNATFPAAGVVHRVYFEKDNGGNCGPLGEAAGNWGWMDFNGGSNTNADTRDWLQFGYAGGVGIHVPVPWCTDHDPPDGCLNGQTGDKGNAMDSELGYLTTNQIKFYVPIFDTAVANGNNVAFTIRAFVGVILRGYSHGNDGYFDVEFYDAIFTGGCCSDTGVPTGALATKICAIDHDPVSESTRCTPS
jgi:Flp pilus assembly protein TadG